MTILDIRGVTRRFGGLTAVDDVTFGVDSGAVNAIIGPNGAGKTTLFSMISGFLAPSEGRIVFDGVDITGHPPEVVARRGLVRTFQLVKLFEDLSVLENVKVGRHLHTKSGLASALFRPPGARHEEAAVEARAIELLDLVGLRHKAGTAAASLGYGQQRLLEMARALAAEPRLLLLDEPAAGLNASESATLSDLIRRVAARGTTVLLIEHDMKLVMNTADRIVVIDFGRKIAEGTPAQVRADPAVIAAYHGGVNTGEPGFTRPAAVGAG